MQDKSSCVFGELLNFKLIIWEGGSLEFKSYLHHLRNEWLSQLGLQNTPTASLQGGQTPPRNKSPGNDTKSNAEAPVMPELWGMWNTALWPLLPGSLWSRVAVLDRVLSMGEIKLNSVLKLYRIVQNRTVFDI